MAAAVREKEAAEEGLRDLMARVANAQQLADMGDYHWHIPSDTNTWSDQLFRIFGYEPQSQNMSYEIYMEHCHPEDRERITAVHQHSYASGEPFQMTHRIIRIDGEVRHLLCNGMVVTDEDGTPTSLRGTTIDITQRVEADLERERVAAHAHAERTRRQAALEINDSVVQGLTAALYSLELEDNEAVLEKVRDTLDSARAVITDLVAPIDGPLRPGDLVRGSATRL
jgi:PAS domain S-box-containing protein